MRALIENAARCFRQQRQPVDLEEFHKPTQDTGQRPSRSRDSTTGEIFNEYRISMGNPKNGVVFHSEAGEHLDFDKLGRVVRPAVESLRLEWHGWHGFRRGIASNLYEVGATDKIVQRILRHAKPHETRERYTKAFDPAVLAAMKQMEAALDVVSKRLPSAYQVN